MKILRYLSLSVLVIGFAAMSAHAQDGCTDSPEAPTDVLMLVGAIGMVYGSRVLERIVRRSYNGK